MTQEKSPKKPKTQGEIREDRLKAALRANMGRRKAQARAKTQARAHDDEATTPTKSGEA